MNFPFFNKMLRIGIFEVIVFFGLISVTLLEIILPRASAVWVLYIPLISMTLFTRNTKLPFYIASACSIWVFIDLFFFEAHPISSVMIARRGIGTITFFTVALIVRVAVIANLEEQKMSLALQKSTMNLALEKQKLERSNRELEQFAGVAAHDLRSPIKAIRSWTDMLSLFIPAPRSAQLEQALTIIHNNSKRADDLVKDILDIASVNISNSHTCQIDLNQTLREIIETLQSAIETADAQIYISTLPTIVGNQTYIASVFSNLIQNALIYRDKARKLEISIGCTEDLNKYEFFIKDNGIGIDAQFTDRIFEMFKRLHSEKEYPGTGIGLAFCRKVIELSGGKIWVDSLPGRGSTFFFALPKVFLGGEIS